jgi:hypothetical protein
MRGSFPLNGTYFQVNEVNISFLVISSYYHGSCADSWSIEFITGTNVCDAGIR